MSQRVQTSSAGGFNELIFNHLRGYYPDLEESILRTFPSELMEVLRLRASSEDTTAGRAHRIPDFLPGWLNDMALADLQAEIERAASGNSAVPDPAAQAVVPVTDIQQQCMEMLSHITGQVVSGDIQSLCIIATTRDGNQQLLFNMPASNLFGFYGFLGYSLGLVCGNGRPPESA